MRVLLVGPAVDRARLRPRLDAASFEIVGEFPTLAAARTSGIPAEAVVLTPAAEGDRWTRRVPLPPGRTDDEETFDEPLTPREIDVLERLAEGLSNKAIAARLGISDQTVKFHVASIYAKLGAANRADAVRRALRRGLLSL
jgi:DNA-binding NarL/FixJ family response regulator